jgi:hypothetical protein
VVDHWSLERPLVIYRAMILVLACHQSPVGPVDF